MQLSKDLTGYRFFYTGVRLKITSSTTNTINPLISYDYFVIFFQKSLFMIER